MKRLSISLFAPLLIGTSALAEPVEDTIRYRQSAYSLAAWHLATIKSHGVQRPEAFDRDVVSAAANGLAALAGADLDALYAPGSEHGTGWQKTRLDPVYFQKPEEARTLSAALVRETRELARVAATADAAALKVQFGKTSATCKGCHDAFRLKDVDE